MRSRSPENTKIITVSSPTFPPHPFQLGQQPANHPLKRRCRDRRPVPKRCPVKRVDSYVRILQKLNKTKQRETSFALASAKTRTVKRVKASSNTWGGGGGERYSPHNLKHEGELADDSTKASFPITEVTLSSFPVPTNLVCFRSR